MTSATTTEDVKRNDIYNTGFEEREDCLPFIYPHLSPALLEEAKVHLNETEEIKQKCLQEFKAFINNQKNFSAPADDVFLLSFLRARKYNLKESQVLFLKFWKFRKEFSNLFNDIDPKPVQQLLKRNFIGFLPHRDRSGSVVIIFKVGKWNPEIDSFNNMFLSVTTLFLFAIEHDASQIAGIRFIFDTREISWAQMKYCTPSIVYLLIRSTQFCFPARFKGIHFISGNNFFKIIWGIVRPLLTTKLKERVYIHNSDVQALRKVIHPSVLPLEYGGEGPAFETTKWTKYVKEHEDKMLEIANYGYKK